MDARTGILELALRQAGTNLGPVILGAQIGVNLVSQESGSGWRRGPAPTVLAPAVFSALEHADPHAVSKPLVGERFATAISWR